jgi:nitrite reductase/ring-hydroxylating ferredoxin subunit
VSETPVYRPPHGVRLCALAEIAEPGARGFRFRDGDRMFAGFVVRSEGKVLGYVDSCPHAGWALAMFDDRYFTRDGRHLLCTGHAALFRPEDGVCVSGPCVGDRLTPWPITILGGEIFTA